MTRPDHADSPTRDGGRPQPPSLVVGGSAPAPLPAGLADQMVLAQKMRTIGTLVSGVRHEVNNPLTAVRGYAELIATDPLAADVTRSDARRIGEAGEKAIRLMTTFSDFAREGAPGRDADLGEVIDGALALLRFDLLQPLRPRSSHGVAIAREGDQRLPRVTGDRGRMQQIVVTLLLNSIDAFRARAVGLAGPVGSVGRITLWTGLVDDFVECRISDDGPGVDPAIVDRLFQEAVSTRLEGLGLGLWVAGNLAHAMGGSLAHEPTPGGGATFTLRLRCATEAAGA